MKRILIITNLLLITYLQITGQTVKLDAPETWNWVFGSQAGLTWNTLRNNVPATSASTNQAITLNNMPTAIGSKIGTSSSSLEGVFTVSSPEGNLLFYSDGISIWNGAGDLKYSGLGGDPSSAQSGIVVPYPGTDNKYVCIGIGANAQYRMNYVIVTVNSSGSDITITDNGGGPFSFTGQNGYMSESVSAVKHANGTDWWVVAPGKGTPTYLNAWLITSNGVQSSAPEKITQISATVANPSLPNGYFKFTPDASHFAWGTWGDRQLICGNFDSSTGEFTNVRSVRSNFPTYGVEFSMNQKYLYTTTGSQLPPGEKTAIFIWDFEAVMNGSSDYLSKIDLTREIGALQLDPLGNIWCAIFSTRHMFFIKDADEPTVNIKDQLYLISNILLSGTQAKYGLPSFSASFFALKQLQGDRTMCYNRSTGQATVNYSIEAFKGTGSNSIQYIRWDFGDGTAGVTTGFPSWPSDNVHKVSHNYKKTGVYTITATPYKDAGTPVTEKAQSIEVKINSCLLPVNHNMTSLGE